MTMQRRHFELIAETLSMTKPQEHLSENFPSVMRQWRADVEAFAHACRQSNSRFDRARFLRACGALESR